MTEHGEHLLKVESVREKARQIISTSTDLLEIDQQAVGNILVPRIITHLENKRSGSWAPAGAKLPLEQELGLNLFLNVINFCYKDPQTGLEYVYTDSDGKQIKRATGLIAALANSGVDWNEFSEVYRISDKRWSEIIQLSDDNPMYLGQERGARMAKMARFALRQGPSTITDYLESCQYNAISLAGNLSESGLFNDEFLKRAQLAARMISDVLQRRTGHSLYGLEKLTVMADYRIPQVFYNLDVVQLKDPNLLSKLISDEPIDPGSREELALRATAVSIGETVAELMGVIESEVDGYLWGLSQEMVKRGEMRIPHMLVATDAY